MKLDFELVKTILSKIESDNDWPDPIREFVIDGYDEKNVVYHLLLLYEAKLINGIDQSDRGCYDLIPISLTWEGHAFLANANVPTNWEKLKTVIGTIGDVSFDVAKSSLASMAGTAVAIALQRIH